MTRAVFNLITYPSINLELLVTNTWPAPKTTQTPANKRITERRAAAFPARLMWKDQRGTTRFATVVTKDVSEIGVYVESHSVVSIPLYRIVQFQIEKDALDTESVPHSLRHGRILAAVYRVTPPARGGRQGFALRLMVDPKRQAVPTRTALTA
ncbi:MAG TPA: hypothetical protein VJP86_10475 [Vicinamibacterales bacterium]|nr:hypothetical protein [Vicinamibacterales bacterium]